MSVLYVVGTPIGNLSDLSPRALDTLSKVDFIAAEDTRVTLKLLNHFDIKKPLVSCHEHNIEQKAEPICQRILSGESCAVVTDAGMPCISDPGAQLIRLCQQQNIPVVVVPGPSAVISALAISGLDCTRFTFEGFLSTAKRSRSEHLQQLQQERRTMVFYEAPHKLLATLKDMLSAFGDRRISLCRELTKIHEEVIRTTLSQAVTRYEETAPKGEFVLVIEGAKPVSESEEPLSLQQAVELAQQLMQNKGLSASMAAKDVAKATGYPKNVLYKALVED